MLLKAYTQANTQSCSLPGCRDSSMIPAQCSRHSDWENEWQSVAVMSKPFQLSQLEARDRVCRTPC